MTDWWSTSGARTEGEADPQEWRNRADADMERIARSGENLSREPDDWGYGSQGAVTDLRSDPPPEPEQSPQKPDRRKSLFLGAAGAAVAGILVFAAMPDGSPGVPTDASSGSPSAQQGDFPPAAGGGPAEGAEDREEAATAPAPEAPPEAVTLSASPKDSGQVGAIVEVTIANNTDEALVVMASMVKGDGRPAVLGEGTLAPGSRRIEPGENVTGTVEFATKEPPAQILLMDISGNVVAASG